MKLIKNIRKRIQDKRDYETALRIKVRREFEERENRLENQHREELERKDEKYREKLEYAESGLETEIKKIRAQEQRRFNAIIEEREKEIKRLKETINGIRDFVETMRIREYSLENTAKEAVEFFKRGHTKMAEGIQLIERGQKEIDEFNREQARSDKRKPLEIKEV